MKTDYGFKKSEGRREGHSTNALVLDIARIAEASFRRGYQHGHAAGCGDLGDVPSEKAVTDWRFFCNRNNAEIPPHEKNRAWRITSLERLTIECDRDNYPALYELLRTNAKADQ